MKLYKNNRENTSIKYAHVDSINIFYFLDKVFAMQRNNPVKEFDKHTDIESWLKIQWSGLFRELIHSKSQSDELKSLKSQIEALSDINTTLKRYLEELITNEANDKGSNLIKEEQARLQNSEIRRKLSELQIVDTGLASNYFDLDEFIEVFTNSNSLKEFSQKMNNIVNPDRDENYLYNLWTSFDDEHVLKDLLAVSKILNSSIMATDIKQYLKNNP